MKKLIISILLSVFMISSSGLALELHYCMGRLAEVELPGEEHDRCGLCGMKDKEGCCHDELRFYKLDDSFKHIQNDLSLAQPVKFIQEPVYFSDGFILLASSARPASGQFHGPPGKSGNELCDLHCIYRL